MLEFKIKRRLKKYCNGRSSTFKVQGWKIYEMLGLIKKCWNVYPVKQRKAFLRSRVSLGLGYWNAGMLGY